MTQPITTVVDRHSPPVAYDAIRRPYQLFRAIAAAAIGSVALVGAVAWQANTELKALLALAIAVDAVVRLRRTSGPFWSIASDTALIVAFSGEIGHFDAALMAGAAYILVVSLTLLRFPTACLVIGAATVGAAIRIMAFHGTIAGESSPFAEWSEAMILLGAVSGVMWAFGNAVEAARSDQESALHTERRASEIRSDFVSMITHELRTPLTTISGFLMTLRDAWSDLSEEEIEEFLGIMSSETDHLQTLVDDVLTIPRLESGNLLLDITDFQLRPSAYRIADLIFPAGGERTASVSIAGSVVVSADPNRVEQILRNLLENARKYGGDEVSVEANRVADVYEVVVADNGPGVPADQRESIFEAFQQATSGDARSDQGFGLGLAITRKLVEAMGGAVRYEAGFPVGSRFCFTLPAATLSVGIKPHSLETVTEV